MTEKKKSVLLLCADFFGYDKRIREAMQDAGYDVELVEEKPGRSVVAKSCIRFNVKG